MAEVSPIRLWVMRAMYLVMAAGITLTVWPLIIRHTSAVPRMTGVAWALLGTIGLLSLLGLRYPLQMLPLLLVELTWKAIWLLAFALPRWLDGTLDQGMRASVMETSLGVVLLAVIPWHYVWTHYVVGRGEPWTFRRQVDEGVASRAAS
jgi:hypothetical protein